MPWLTAKGILATKCGTQSHLPSPGACRRVRRYMSGEEHSNRPLQSESLPIRTIAVCDSPVLCAINRVLQCVLLAGIDSNVFVITSSIWLSLIDRGAPGRRFIEQPFQTSHTKSFPPFADRCSRDPEPLGSAALLAPPWQASTIRARMASA